MTSDPVWQYFIALEADLAVCARYVELAEDNFATYSVEFSKILLAAGSETDVVCKALCRLLGAKPGKIEQYRRHILDHFPALPTVVVLSSRYRLRRTPWLEWSDSVSPAWWRAYNRVKHRRHDSYRQANLKHALDALGGLLVVALYLHRLERPAEALHPLPQILDLERLNYGWLGVAENYHLPGAEPDARRYLVT